jgi:hypothetical protein
MIMFVSLLNPPKKQIENFPTASYLAKQQDAGQLYYSLPGIFQPTVKETGLSSFQSLAQTTQVKKRSYRKKRIPIMKLPGKKRFMAIISRLYRHSMISLCYPFRMEFRHQVA